MKKNKAMRAAGGLFVATMLTTSIISGTYAKYVTSDSGTDSARVAVFGVEVKASGSMFAKTYINAAGGNTPTTGTAGLTVSSSNNENVVAPGTKNTDGLAFSISGTPEVAVRVSFKVDEDTLKDIYLNAPTGTAQYPDMTTGDKTDGFTFTGNYYPVVYKLVLPDTASATGTTTTEGTLAEIAAKLNSFTLDYAPGQDLSDVLNDVKLTWEWAFPATENKETDKKDTLLGDLAARDFGSSTIFSGETNAAPAAPADGSDGAYSVKTNIDITVSVTQID